MFPAWLFNFEITHQIGPHQISTFSCRNNGWRENYPTFTLHLLMLVHNVKYICKFPYCGLRLALMFCVIVCWILVINCLNDANTFKNVHLSVFSNCMVDVWHSLPESVVTGPSLNQGCHGQGKLLENELFSTSVLH